jgi:hypothetical protein
MKKILPRSFREGGQALLVVLLVMAVILTVVLSIISRSVTDVSITSLDEEALRAFSAAEAGIERALLTGTSVSDEVGGSSFNAVISGIAQGAQSFAYPTEIYSGESVYIWFVSHDTTGDLVCNTPDLPCYTGNSASFCWGRTVPPTDPNGVTTPAIEVSVFYDPSLIGVSAGDFSSVRVARVTFDSNTSRRLDNHFSADQGSCTLSGPGGESYAFSGDVAFGTDANPATIDLNIPCAGSSGCLLAARVRAIYNTDFTHPLGIDVSPATLPAQGRKIDSTGTSASGESVRKIEAYRTFGGPPPIFDSSVFSQGSVVK